ncbi:hypothetical protein FQZ97_908560 [compost metagenome]
MQRLRRHRLDDGAGKGDVRIAAADHHRQLAACGTGRPAGHGRVDEAVAEAGKGCGEITRDIRLGCRGVDDHDPRAGRFQRLEIGLDDSGDVLRGRQREDDEIGIEEDVGERGDRGNATFGRKGAPGFRKVETFDRETLSGERRRHAEPHGAQSHHAHCRSFRRHDLLYPRLVLMIGRRWHAGWRAGRRRARYNALLAWQRLRRCPAAPRGRA